MPAYDIISNYDKPYRVYVEADTVTVCPLKYNYESRQYVECDATHRWDGVHTIFIGKSPYCAMTAHSGAYGEEYDGNNILIRPTAEKTYIHIGGRITTFRARNVIETFVSPIGNNELPYPYAIDSKGWQYLVAESVRTRIALHAGDDPYAKYYAARAIEAYPIWYIGEQKCDMLKYDPNPKHRFKALRRYVPEGPADIYVCTHDSPEKIHLNRDAYVRIMKEYGVQMNFHLLNTKPVPATS
jgi:hypothetical protein